MCRLSLVALNRLALAIGLLLLNNWGLSLAHEHRDGPEAAVDAPSVADGHALGVPTEIFITDQASCPHGCRASTTRCSGCRKCDTKGDAQPGLIQLLCDRRDWCWTARVDSIVMWRNAPRDRPLFSTIIPNTALLGPTALNANQLESDPLAAPRVSLFRGDGCGESVEATYLYAGNFYAQHTLPFVLNGYATSPPGLFGNSWGPSPDPAADTSLSSANATLTGNLQSVELNRRTTFGKAGSQFLFGFRWLQWHERLQIFDGFSHQPTPPDPAVIGRDSYLTVCTNNLIGGQIGLDGAVLTTSAGFRVEGLAKAGAYYNAASQSSSFSYVDTGPFEYAREIALRSPGGASFVGEVGLTAVVPLSQRWDLRCGYFGLWVEGLAQPVNQLSKQTLTQVDPPEGNLDLTGSLVLQGISLGLEGRW